MKEEKNEFLGLLCNLYLVVLLVVLPLYTGNGYWQLGDTKYMLFRNLSFLCLGGWMLAGMPGRIRGAAEYFRRRSMRQNKDGGTILRLWLAGDGAVRQEDTSRKAKTAERKQRGRGGKGRKQTVFSGMDFAMMSYGFCVILSALCSSYGRLAWVGYEGWYMGAISQLLFIGIYLFVSRQYDGAAWPVYLGEAAFFLVTLLGLLHRLGIDPLGLMGSWNSRDWEYSHMLSTLGNINWLCGYYSVVTAFVIVPFFREKRRCLQVVLYLIAVSAFVLLLLQGSQSGLLILGAGVAVCFWLGKRQDGVWGKLLLLLAGTFLCMPLMEWLMRLRGSRAAIAADGNIFAFTSWYGWMLSGVICIFLFLLLEKRGGGSCRGKPTEEKGKRQMAAAEEQRQSVRRGWARKTLLLIAMAVFATAAVLAGLLFWRGLDDSFGSGRGFLWRIAVESFIEADGKDKLLGAGPDCYAEAVFNRLGADTDVWKGEHWEGAVFTNAHNEILSQLCNVGILGTACYLAIFLAGIYRYGFEGVKKQYGDKYFGGAECRGTIVQTESLEGQVKGSRAENPEGEAEDRTRTENLERQAEGRTRTESSEGEAKGRAQQMLRNPEEHMKYEVPEKADGRRRKGSLTGGDMGDTGVLALVMYGLHSLVSFQQVLNAPLLFLVLGLCEAEKRKKNREGTAEEIAHEMEKV